METVTGKTAIRELRWLRRHAPEFRAHCDELEGEVRRWMRRRADRARRDARRDKERAHDADALGVDRTPEAAA